MNTRRHSADASLQTAILSLVAAALLTVTSGFWVIRQLEQLAPAIGGIIVFQPSTVLSERWSVTADVTAPMAGFPAVSATKHCSLSPNVMAVSGGSLVIEARQMRTPPVFLVHWAGGHTDNGPTDCGIGADLVVERTELMRLANAAGGFSSGLGLIGP